MCPIGSFKTFGPWRWRAAQRLHDGCAEGRVSVATVLDQEDREVLKGLQSGTVDDEPALPLGGHEPGPCKDGKMSGHRVVRDVQPPRDFPGWKTARLVLHKQSERLKPSGLGKCRKCFYGTVEFHMSGTIDAIYDDQATGLVLLGG